MLPFSRAGLVWVLTALLGITALTAGLFHARRSATPVTAGPTIPLARTVGVAGQSNIIVHVAGSVAKPGVYRLPSGARVLDAISAAGGGTPAADINNLNLAAKAADGSRIYVPALGETPPASAPSAWVTEPVVTDESAPTRQAASLPEPTPEPVYSPSEQSTTPAPTAGSTRSSRSGELRDPSEGTININTASQTQLERLPRVGPSTAKKIIQYRDEHGGFRTVDELMEIKGIGPKTMEVLRPFVTL